MKLTQKTGEGIISVAPVVTVGCYGGISIFYCESKRSDIEGIRWHIIVNGTTTEVTKEIAQLRGISITTNGVGNSSSLSIIGSEDNNGIPIGCTVVVTSGPPYYDSQSALFTVSDIPPVTNLTITFTNNGTIMNCTWIQPSCLPVNSSYHIFVNNEEKAILYDKDQTSFIYPIVASCVNYSVSVIVGDTDKYQDYQSQPTNESVAPIEFQNYEDIVIDLIHSEVTFMDEIERTIDFVYVIQNVTAFDIERCSLVFYNTYSESSTNKIKEINNLLESYDQSTGMGNYTIGPFNESFIGTYSLALLMNDPSMEPLELTSIEFSTYHVQEVNITHLFNGRIIIACRFAINSDADGCSVRFYQYSNKQTKKILIRKTSIYTDTATMVTDLPAGEYYVRVYDVVYGVTQSSAPAKTLLCFTIDPSNEASVDPVLPSISTPANGLVNDTLSISVTPSMSPSITTTTESPTIIHSIVIALFVYTILLLLLLLLVNTVIFVTCRRKYRNTKHLHVYSEDAMTQLAIAKHIYSELPVHHIDSNVSAIHTHDNTFLSTSTTSESRPTTAIVETANEEEGYLVTPQQPSRSHYENVHALISHQEEMTQVQDSYDENGSSIRSSMIIITDSQPMDSDLPHYSQCSFTSDDDHLHAYHVDNEHDSDLPDDKDVSQFNDIVASEGNTTIGMEENIVPSSCKVFYETVIKKEKRVVMKIADCYQIGESLGMDSDDVENVLKFLTKVGTILYSPDDLPGYVIIKVQPLIERMSALFDDAMFNQAEESEELFTAGIFGKAYLSQIFMTFEQDELSDEELLKIAESVKIVAHVGDEEYFIPSALSPKHDEATHIPFEMYCRPLLIKWDCENFLPQDLFYHMMVNNLFSSTVNDNEFKFKLCDDVNQWRNEIRIREVTGKISGIIKLTDKDDWIEISTTTVNTKEDCPSIYEVMDEAIAKTLRRFEYAGLDQPTVTTLCPLCPSTEEDHLSILSMADNTVTCSIYSSKTAVIIEDISCWFEEHETVPNSVQPDIVPENLSPTIVVGSQPSMEPNFNTDDSDGNQLPDITTQKDVLNYISADYNFT